MRCVNNRCVTRQENESRYVASKFWIVDEKPLTVRCVYCDYEYEPSHLSRASTKKYTSELGEWLGIYERTPQDLVLFGNEQEAIDAGHQIRRSKKRSGRTTANDGCRSELRRIVHQPWGAARGP